jgi:hypothetical protein
MSPSRSQWRRSSSSQGCQGWRTSFSRFGAKLWWVIYSTKRHSMQKLGAPSRQQAPSSREVRLRAKRRGPAVRVPYTPAMRDGLRLSLRRLPRPPTRAQCRFNSLIGHAFGTERVETYSCLDDNSTLENKRNRASRSSMKMSLSVSDRCQKPDLCHLIISIDYGMDMRARFLSCLELPETWWMEISTAPGRSLRGIWGSGRARRTLHWIRK